MTAGPVAMTCSEVDELGGAYAVGALPADELQAVEDHLASCRLSEHLELHELSQTAGLLPFAVDPVAPPAGLGARIVAAATALQGGRSAAEATSTNVVAFQRRFSPAVAFALGAAAMALIAAGLGAWGLSQRSALTDARATLRRQSDFISLLASAQMVVQTPASQSLPAALLVQPRGGGPAYLLQEWPAPAPGKIYQAWYIAQGKPVSAGLFSGSSGGLQAARLAAPASGAQAFAVTIEPAGGSPQPTTQPLFVRPLT